MSWAMILTGVSAAGLLTLGTDAFISLDGVVAGFCELSGVAATIVFFGLADGA